MSDEGRLLRARLRRRIGFKLRRRHVLKAIEAMMRPLPYRPYGLCAAFTGDLEFIPVQTILSALGGRPFSWDHDSADYYWPPLGEEAYQQRLMMLAFLLEWSQP